MFLDKKYVLVSELITNMGISISNISMLHKKLREEDNETDIIKLGLSSFINSGSPMYPKNITQALHKYEYSDISCMLPRAYVLDEFNLTLKELNTLIEDYNIPEFKATTKICDKYMIEFNKDFVDEIGDKITYALDHYETMECYGSGTIDGYMKLTENKYMTWYSVHSDSSPKYSNF